MVKKTARKAWPVKRIATHYRPHNDEMWAIFYLWFLPIAEKLYPGVNTAGVTFWDAGTGTPDGRTAQAWLEESQTLCVGVGDGPLNEHPTSERRRIKGECAATLVAKEIGIDQLPQSQIPLAYARAVDLESVKGDDDFSVAIKRMHLCSGLTHDQVFEWIMLAIRAKFEESPQTNDFTVEGLTELIRMRYPEHLAMWEKQMADLLAFEDVQWPQAAADHAKTANITFYKGYNHYGKLRANLKLVSVQSDSTKMGGYARAPELQNVNGEDKRATITIIQRSNGNVAIMGNQHRLVDVAKVIKTAEAKKSGATDLPNWNVLEAEGKHGVWHYAPAGEFLLNGSNTAVNVSPTKLTLDEIVELVRMALSVKEFAPTRAEKCQAGRCTNTERSPCPWHDYGLERCRVIRVKWAEERKSAQVA